MRCYHHQMEHQGNLFLFSELNPQMVFFVVFIIDWDMWWDL